MPLLYSISYYLMNMNYDNNVTVPVPPPKSLLTMYLFASYSRGILLLISALFLGDSIFRIKKSINQV